MTASKARVLVVEDDGDIAEVLRRSLRLEGYDVRLADDGAKALDESSLFEPDELSAGRFTRETTPAPTRT